MKLHIYDWLKKEFNQSLSFIIIILILLIGSVFSLEFTDKSFRCNDVNQSQICNLYENIVDEKLKECILDNSNINGAANKSSFISKYTILFLAITFFTYLLVYSLISLISKPLNLAEEIIKNLERNKLDKALKSENLKESKDISRLTSLIKNLHLVSNYDKDSSYKLSMQNLVKVYDAFSRVKYEYSTYSTTYKKYDNFLTTSNEDSKKHLRLKKLRIFLNKFLFSLLGVTRYRKSKIFKYLIPNIEKKEYKKLKIYLDEICKNIFNEIKAKERKEFKLLEELGLVKLKDIKEYLDKNNKEVTITDDMFSYNPLSDFIPSKDSIDQILMIYKQIDELLDEKDEKYKKTTYYIIQILEKYKNKYYKNDKNDNFKNLFTLSSVILLEEKKYAEYRKVKIEEKDNKTSESDRLKKYRDILQKLKEFNISEKQKQHQWVKVIELAEQQANHTLLAEFKTFDLRIRPFKIKNIKLDINTIAKESKILDIYYKIYNILDPMLQKKESNDNRKIDSELLQFMQENIINLKEHKFNIIKVFLIKAIKVFSVFSFFVLSLFSLINLYIDNSEIFWFNLDVLLDIILIFMGIYIVFYIKRILYKKFFLYKSSLNHYINNISTVLTVSAIIFFIIKMKHDYLTELMINNCVEQYSKIGEIFGQLLLPSSFSHLHEEYALAESDILGYKVVFLLILAYAIFTVVNFLIKKYDSLYFTAKRKILVPPELATISVNFLLAIVFLTLIYGSTMNYINTVNNNQGNERSGAESVDDNNSKVEMIGADKNKVEMSSVDTNAESMSDYIPFSIFLAIIGGLLTMATRDLLENYFAGLSLQMDSPYEEFDRITINDSEMLEVMHIGIRADRFYGIKSNAEIVIPHKKLIEESIVNYTLPTLDYRHELTIYVPQIPHDNDQTLPKRAEMLLLLAIFVNTGVKIPKLNLTNKDKNRSEIKTLDLVSQLKRFNILIKKKQKKLIDKKITKKEYNALLVEKSTQTLIENIWKVLKKEQVEYETTDTHHPLKDLFMLKLIETVEAAIVDTDQKYAWEEDEVILKIKFTVVSILSAIYQYQELEKKLDTHLDNNLVFRKYKMFREKDANSKKLYLDIAKQLSAINYYYFVLADGLWKLKDLQNSLYRKRDVDSASLELLDVPRVLTEHEYSGESDVNYWKVTASVTLELSEQSSEIVHHINMYIDDLWEVFDLPSSYKVEIKEKRVQPFNFKGNMSNRGSK